MQFICTGLVFPLHVCALNYALHAVLPLLLLNAIDGVSVYMVHVFNVTHTPS